MAYAVGDSHEDVVRRNCTPEIVSRVFAVTRPLKCGIGPRRMKLSVVHSMQISANHGLGIDAHSDSRFHSDPRIEVFNNCPIERGRKDTGITNVTSVKRGFDHGIQNRKSSHLRRNVDLIDILLRCVDVKVNLTLLLRLPFGSLVAAFADPSGTCDRFGVLVGFVREFNHIQTN